MGCLKLNSCACCNKGKGQAVRTVILRRTSRIQAAWEAQKEVREVTLFLRSHGINSAYATRVYKVYEQDAIYGALRLQDVLTGGCLHPFLGTRLCVPPISDQQPGAESE